MNDRLALMQLADSFFPTGSFTLSHGLEYLVQTQQITNKTELQTFLKILLSNKIGSCDLVALIHAYKGSFNNDFSLIQKADLQLYNQTLIAQNRQIQQKSGRALLMVAKETWQNEKLEKLQQKITTGKIYGLHPIVLAIVAEIAGIDQENTALAFLHSYITGLLGAAIRLGIIGHLQAQKTLLELAPEIKETCNQSQTLQLDRMWSCTPTIDLAQMQHQQLRSRLFAS